MKISIQELWYNCKIHLETNLFENNSKSINWLPHMTPLSQYLKQKNDHQTVIQIHLPNSNTEQGVNTTIPFPKESMHKEKVSLSKKKIKKLQRLSKILYQIDNEYNIEPTSFVQSYFQHKTYSYKAKLDSKIQNLESMSYASPVDQKVKKTFKDWCENGFKYEYEQILYFFNQIGTLIPANLSDYFSITTGLTKINFKSNTYLPFSQINTADIWSSIQVPYKKGTNKHNKPKTPTSQFSFDFAQIPIVNTHFPSSTSSINSDNLLSKSILLLRNVLFEGQEIALGEALNWSEPLVIGFKYEKMVH